MIQGGGESHILGQEQKKISCFWRGKGQIDLFSWMHTGENFLFLNGERGKIPYAIERGNKKVHWSLLGEGKSSVPERGLPLLLKDNVFVPWRVRGFASVVNFIKHKTHKLSLTWGSVLDCYCPNIGQAGLTWSSSPIPIPMRANSWTEVFFWPSHVSQ
jgi:hypothetical protein